MFLPRPKGPLGRGLILLLSFALCLHYHDNGTKAREPKIKPNADFFLSTKKSGKGLILLPCGAAFYVNFYNKKQTQEGCEQSWLEVVATKKKIKRNFDLKISL